MRIIHTADWHIGQIIYQYYDREEEHQHFFRQLSQWCKNEQPDALVVSGDIFDTALPSAIARRFYTEQIMHLRQECPEMIIIIIAGNHDSASRLEAEKALWNYANVYVVGIAPSSDIHLLADGWQENYIVELPNKGYVVAMPFYNGSRKEVIQKLLDYVAERNTTQLPVVELAHQWVQGMTTWGTEIGNLAEKGIDEFGTGYDYLALGHIHKPHTIGNEEDVVSNLSEQVLSSPVARYSGSALHVNASEQVPHSVSVVEIDRHGGNVHIRPLRINEWMHFYTLPQTGDAIGSEEQLQQVVQAFVNDHNKRGYFRLRVKNSIQWKNDPDKLVEQIIEGHEDKARFNPQTIYEGIETEQKQSTEITFEVEDFQQMTDPLDFIRKTINQYPQLDVDKLEEDFKRISERVRQMEENKNTHKKELS